MTCSILDPIDYKEPSGKGETYCCGVSTLISGVSSVFSLCRFYACCYIHYEFIWATDLSCLEIIVTWSNHLPPLILTDFMPFLLQWSLRLSGKKYHYNIEFLFSDKQFASTYSTTRRVAMGKLASKIKRNFSNKINECR